MKAYKLINNLIYSLDKNQKEKLVEIQDLDLNENFNVDILILDKLLDSVFYKEIIESLNNLYNKSVERAKYISNNYILNADEYGYKIVYYINNEIKNIEIENQKDRMCTLIKDFFGITENLLKSDIKEILENYINNLKLKKLLNNAQLCSIEFDFIKRSWLFQASEYICNLSYNDAYLENVEYYKKDIESLSRCVNPNKLEYLFKLITSEISYKSKYHLEDMKLIEHCKDITVIKYLFDLAINSESLKSNYHAFDMQIISNFNIQSLNDIDKLCKLTTISCIKQYLDNDYHMFFMYYLSKYNLNDDMAWNIVLMDFMNTVKTGKLDEKYKEIFKLMLETVNISDKEQEIFREMNNKLCEMDKSEIVLAKEKKY